MWFTRPDREPPSDVDLDALRDALDRGEVSLALLFGSYGTGHAGPLSDLDVAIRFESSVGSDRRSKLKLELLAAIEGATGISAIDLVDLDAVGPALGYEALATGTLVHGDAQEAATLEGELLCRKLDLEPIRREWAAALDDRVREGTFGRP